MNNNKRNELSFFTKIQPFANGLATSVQHAENALQIWNTNDLATPVHSFNVKPDKIIALDWRSV